MFLLLFISFCSSSVIPEENNVWVLDSETLPKALSLQSNLLVEFYAPWCDHCKELAPEYEKAGKILKDKKIHIGKIDGSQSRDLVDKYNVKGYPTLLYFQEAHTTEYTGMRAADTIVEWVLARQQRKIFKTSEYGGLSEAVQSHPLLALYIGKVTDPERGVFEFAALNVKDVIFLETDNEEEAAHLDVTAPKIVMFENGVKKIYDSDYSTLELVKFIEKHKPAKVHEFNDQTARMIFDYQSSTFFFLRKEEEKEQHQKMLEELAGEFKENFIFTVVDLRGKGNPERLAMALGITAEEQPLAVIVDFKESFNKFKTSSTSKEGLKEFIKDYSENKLKPYLKSAPTPKNEFENSVKVLVGRNYQETVSDPSKDVAVLYCTSEHPKCKEFLPIYERIAKDTKKWEGFLPCKFDLSANEAEGLKIRMLPHLRLFTKDDKEGKIYGGEFTKGAVKGFFREFTNRDKEDL